ncbi:hypothetical protein Prudu_021797, partial [Prunus dulcis]
RARLMEVKYRIITNININHQSCMSIEAKNSILKAELDELTNILTGPDPISTLKFEPSPVRVRHLANEKFLQLYLTLKRGGLGRHAVHPSRKLAKSGDYDQPVPPADSSVTPSQLESLWQDAGDRSQPDPQSWQVSGTQSQPSRNPGRSRDT